MIYFSCKANVQCAVQCLQFILQKCLKEYRLLEFLVRIQWTDTWYPFITQAQLRSHLNKGCTVCTHIWKIILSTVRSQNHFYCTEIHLGSQNLHDYISNRCVYHFFQWDLCRDASGLKKGNKQVSVHWDRLSNKYASISTTMLYKIHKTQLGFSIIYLHYYYY